jgi:hypothetical protein
MQPRSRIGNRHARSIDPLFSQQQLQELENTINHCRSEARPIYREHVATLQREKLWVTLLLMPILLE